MTRSRSGAAPKPRPVPAHGHAGPEVSIIIPAYNVAPYIERCLDSAVGQTLASLEVIVIDDGSTDGSAAICDAWAQRHCGRLRVIHQDNAGVSAARNRGIEAARGRYLAFVDADDYVATDFTERLHRLACRGRSQLAKGLRVTQFADGTQQPRPDVNHAIRQLGSPRCLCAQWITAIYARELFTRHGLRFDEQLRYAEDLLFLYQAASHCSRIAVDNAARYFYCRREGSADSGSVSERQAGDAVHVVTAIMVDLEQTGRDLSEGVQALLWGRLLDLLEYVERRAASPEVRQQVQACARELRRRCPVAALLPRHHISGLKADL